jgi:hypothetical protein
MSEVSLYTEAMLSLSDREVTYFTRLLCTTFFVQPPLYNLPLSPLPSHRMGIPLAEE